ncbi:MAG: glycine-rich protein [Tenericutes bacterium]|nr:glycine-rich protein [Mycoplasmatota bacterium]
MKKKKQLVLTVIAIVTLIVITIGVSYAFFSYTKKGTTENSIKTGTITFLYTEVTGVGKGIKIEDSLPMTDEQGKLQTGNGNVFEFKVTSDTLSNTSIPYEVTARKSSDSTLDEAAVKLYLTEVDGEESELLLDNYSNLKETDTKVPEGIVEKTLYKGRVPVNTTKYEKNFKLRMWLDEEVDFSDGSMNAKTFTITVNVYANGKIVTSQENKVYTFDYTGDVQIFDVPDTGIYKLETWGAQGGSASTTYIGGYGGYSTGYVSLTAGQKLYVYDGGSDGYNGGGVGSTTNNNGGGATHIATKSGFISTLSSSKDTILIVSGGGGGSVDYGSSSPSGSGGNAGGFTGSNGLYGGWTSKAGSGGTQTDGGTYGSCSDGTVCGITGSFGQGGSVIQCSSSNCDTNYQAGGGGGFYGGGSARHSGGGGGSSYIGNSILNNKVMYCYNCEESNDEATKTISTTCANEIPTENCAKQGNGYAKITYLGSTESTTVIKTISVNDVTLKKVTNKDYDYEGIMNFIPESLLVNVTAIFNSKVTVEIENQEKLNYGDNYFTLKVISEDTTTTSEYKIKITVRKSVSIFGKKYSVIDAEPTLTTSSSNSNDESGLYKSTATNTGEATYYFRGNVTNNYVSFAGETWRIVRINEDGTIKLIMQNGIDNNGGRSFSSCVDNYKCAYYSNSNAKTALENWYSTNIESNADYSKYVVTGNYYCEQAKVNGSYKALENTDAVNVSSYVPDFKCVTDGNGYGIVNSNIGLLTYDEAIFAGSSPSQNNDNYYLLSGTTQWWTMSSGGVNTYSGYATCAWSQYAFGSMSDGRTTNYGAVFRPVINIKADATTTGSGTSSDPFIIQ